MREQAHVREVGLRDGIQMVKTILPSARRSSPGAARRAEPAFARSR